MQASNIDVVLIGSGNLATQLGVALQKKNIPVKQVYSRTLESAKQLGERLCASYTNSLDAIVSNATAYIFAVTDAALPEVLEKFPHRNGLYVHTAGSLPLSVFEGYTDHFGVFYPLQTFSKSKDISFDHLPLFIEANNPQDEALLLQLASCLSDQVCVLSSEKRKKLHLAAVFACNFTNHLYALSAGLLEEEDIPWSTLIPLIQETASKIETMHPIQAQTGPAIRHDQETMKAHLDILKDKEYLSEIYQLMSEGISGSLL